MSPASPVGDDPELSLVHGDVADPLEDLPAVVPASGDQPCHLGGPGPPLHGPEALQEPVVEPAVGVGGERVGGRLPAPLDSHHVAHVLRGGRVRQLPQRHRVQGGRQRAEEQPGRRAGLKRRNKERNK